MKRILSFFLLPVLLASCFSGTPDAKPSEPSRNAAVAGPSEPSAVGTPKSAVPNGKAANSTDCLVKGNVSSKGERIYHVPGGGYYGRTEIDESAGERWFCSEEEAREAGWRKSKR